ncbi:RNA polymerase sigma factor SigM [Gordonia sp. VNQ95]|jgi:RNA polymerase sigma-70 factor (ECF subfamily)|uniref:RNA polymerase sigma factor SigM n=1 Tax=Gordonia TaxID=2053 RepID=UPI0032B5951F
MPGGARQHSDTRTDEQLLTAHTHGDPTAFTTLITRHQNYLWRIALRTTGNPHDAADALQEALIAAHRTAAAFRGEARVTSWLHRIVVNASLDRMRRNASQRTISLSEPDNYALAGSADEYGRVELTLAIEDALDQLPANQRAAIIAIDVEGYTMDEASQLLGVPVGTLKSRSARGRYRLADLLGYLRGADS